MVVLEEFEDLRSALALAEWLNQTGTACFVETQGEKAYVILRNEKSYHAAQQELARFHEEPNHPRYGLPDAPEEVNTEIRHVDGAWQRLSFGLRDQWDASGLVTRAVGIVSLVVFVLTGFGTAQSSLNHFEFFNSTSAMASLEQWRWISPVFIHYLVYGLPLHILFNLMWWWELGGFIERFQSTRRLVWLFVIIAVLSNTAQFISAGNNFGGLSGVVYGLLGYLWFYGRVYPESGVQLNTAVLNFMLVWLVVCFTGVMGPVANAAHLGGLLAGSLLAIMLGSKDRAVEFTP